MSTTEFQHYRGCRFKDTQNCSGCALTTGGTEGPNYAAWPLSYLENGRRIPEKWYGALQSAIDGDNRPYALNVWSKLTQYEPKLAERMTKPKELA